MSLQHSMGLQIYNQTRIDHFRAFAGYWAVPATAETAMNGEWRKGPGAELFEAVDRLLGDAGPKIMAEDLGVITTDVKTLRCEIGAPGMVVLQFAWGGGSDNTHLPHNHYANSFVYPGTTIMRLVWVGMRTALRCVLSVPCLSLIHISEPTRPY